MRKTEITIHAAFKETFLFYVSVLFPCLLCTRFCFDQFWCFVKDQEWSGESSRLLLFEQATKANFKFINTRLLSRGKVGVAHCVPSVKCKLLFFTFQHIFPFAKWASQHESPSLAKFYGKHSPQHPEFRRPCGFPSLALAFGLLFGSGTEPQIVYLLWRRLP